MPLLFRPSLHTALRRARISCAALAMGLSAPAAGLADGAQSGVRITDRTALPATGGASLVGEDMLLMRLLAPDSFLLRRTLVPILNRLIHNALPRPWMI